MSSLIVEVCLVNDVQKHPNADNLDVISVKGWNVVSRSGIYNPGQKCVYIPPDTILTEELSEKLGVTKYLHPLEKDEMGNRPPGGRIRVASLRGIKSFGLIMPCENPDWEVGYSVVEHYNFKKWEPTIKCVDKDAEKPHPAFHRYTDIEHYQNFPDVFQEQEEIVLTEKMHGCMFSWVEVPLGRGGQMQIGEIVNNKLDVEVLTYNFETKTVEPKKVINWFKGEKELKWFKLYTKPSNKDKVVSFKHFLECTHDHPVHTTEGVKPAGTVKVGDVVYAINVANRKVNELEVSQVILDHKIPKPRPTGAYRYNIEVEDNHNYFAYNILVHNCNTRVGLIKDTNSEFSFMVGSHNVRRKEYYDVEHTKIDSITKKPLLDENGNMIKYSKTVKCKFWDCLNENIKNLLVFLCENRYNVIVFGEMLGTQDMKYGVNFDFRAFDIAIDGNYMDFDLKQELFKRFNVSMCPVLYKGKFDKKVIQEHTDGPTTLCSAEKSGNFKGREGCVIYAAKERTDARLGRVILKSVSFDYLNRKKGTEGH